MICCFMHFDFSHIHRTIKYKEKVIINNGQANLFEKAHNFVVTYHLKTLQQLRPLFCQKLQFMQISQYLKILMIHKFFFWTNLTECDFVHWTVLHAVLQDPLASTWWAMWTLGAHFLPLHKLQCALSKF